MLSNFQVIDSVWLPEIVTVGFAARVRMSPVVLHAAVPAAQVATWLKAELLKVPEAPVALLQVAAFQLTSVALQVVAPTDGGVKEAAPALTEIFSCLVAVASTIVLTLTDAA